MLPADTPAKPRSARSAPAPRDGHRAPHVPWERPTGPGRWALPAALLLLAACTVPRLPPGICFGDGGELQVAASTLGIAHPPGYAGFVSLGYLLTLLPGAAPAYLVTLGCLGAGLTALWLAALLEVRLGVSPWLAAASSLLLASHPRVWENLVVPEVYAPALACELGAAYLLYGHARFGRRRHLLLAAGLLGFAAANRPPVLLALPAFAGALWLTLRRARSAGRRQGRGGVLLAAGCFCAPLIYSLAYLYLRDTPTNPYNYLEQRQAASGDLPASDGGLTARARRIGWLISGQEFRRHLVLSPAGAPARLHWLAQRLGLGNDLAFVAAASGSAVGLVIVRRRCPACALLLAGMGLAAGVYAYAYRVYDAAADVLPLLAAATVLVSLAATALLRAAGPRPGGVLALTVFASASGLALFAARQRPDPAADATAFVRAADLGALPPDAVILTSWMTAPPLWYARELLSGRDDITIISTGPRRRPGLVPPGARTPWHRPVYTTSRLAAPRGARLAPWGNLWRIDFPPPATEGQKPGR